MPVIEHGDWQFYTPASLPEGAPNNAMFASRVDDGVDWYDYVNSSSNFQSGSARMTVYRQGVNGPTVGAAVFDATELWPAQALVVEDTDYTGSDPQGDYGGKIYDPVTKTFSDPPPPSAELFVSPEMQLLKDRIAALEAKAGGA